MTINRQTAMDLLSRRRKTLIGRDNGVSYVVVLIMIGIGGFICFAVLGFLEMSRAQARYEAMASGRGALKLELEDAFQTPAVVLSSIQKYNLSAQNPDFDNCLKTGDPAGCSADLGLVIVAQGETSMKLAGPPGNEAYFSLTGEQCDPNASSCAFRVALRLHATCPNSINPCPFTKIFVFDYTLESLSGWITSMRPIRLDSFARYSIELHQAGYAVSLTN